MPCIAPPDDRWLDVHRLMERWALRPSSAWQALADRERFALAPSRLGAPQNYEQWVIRDFIETAWWLATRYQPASESAWIHEACLALEHAALHLLR